MLLLQTAGFFSLFDDSFKLELPSTEVGQIN